MESKKDLDLLVENFFKPKKKKTLLNLGALLEMVEQAMDADVPLLREDAPREAAGADKFPLPKLRITEAWGSPESDDREIIEKYSKNIPGATLQAKLQYLADVIEGKIVLHDVQPIISTLVMIEVLSTILADFTESAGGFIFEGFLAGLFGGESVQVTDVSGNEAGAVGKPITDVRLGGKEYSLKLLGQKTGVKGSFKNMVEHFKSGKTHVIYLDARRVGKDEGLEFGEFTITLDNFLDVFFKPFAGIKKKMTTANTVKVLSNKLAKFADQVYKIKAAAAGKGLGTTRRIFSVEEVAQIDPDILATMAPFEIHYSEESFAKSPKAKDLFGTGRLFNDVAEAIESRDKARIFAALEATPGYQKSRKFEFTRRQAESIRKGEEGGFEVIAVLPLGDEALKKAWMNYAELLNSTIAPVYRFLGIYDESITNYFTGEGDNRNSEAGNAVSAAEDLRKATDEAVAVIGKAAEREK